LYFLYYFFKGQKIPAATRQALLSEKVSSEDIPPKYES
jgi:hypothetical protein